MTDRATRPLAYLSLAPLAAVYLLFPARNHSEAEDALSYVVQVGAGRPDWHPNHLLYEPLSALLHRLATALGHDGNALPVMQGLSTAAALVVLACVLTLVARRAPVWGAMLSVWALGLSFGFWLYAVEADTYLPPLAFLALALVILDRDAPPPPVPLALLVAGAVLLHQMAVFFAVLVALWLAQAGRGGLRAAARFAGLSGGIVLTVYLVAYGGQGSGGFLHWARGHAGGGLWDPPSALTPVKAAIGLGTALVSPNLMFALPWAEPLIARAMQGKILVEEEFVASTAIGGAGAAAAGAALIALAGLAAVMVWRALAAGRPDRPPDRLGRFLLAAIAFYAVLICLWEPLNREFWIQVVVFAAIWAGRAAPWRDRLFRLSWAGAAACLFAVNFVTAIAPYSTPETDYWYAANAEVIAAAGPGDRIVAECGWICVNTLRFHAGAEVIVPSWVGGGGAADALPGGDGRLIVTSWALAPPAFLGPQVDPVRHAAFLTALENRFGALPAPGAERGFQARVWAHDGTAWRRLTP